MVFCALLAFLYLLWASLDPVMRALPDKGCYVHAQAKAQPQAPA
jgi:hypothetical protein